MRRQCQFSDVESGLVYILTYTSYLNIRRTSFFFLQSPNTSISSNASTLTFATPVASLRTPRPKRPALSRLPSFSAADLTNLGTSKAPSYSVADLTTLGTEV